MQKKNITRAELATALGIAPADVTAMTVAPPRYGMREPPAYEPSTYDLEVSVEVGEVGGRHVVFRRTRVWADRRQIHSSAVSAAICGSAGEARQRADALRIEGTMNAVAPLPRVKRRGKR